MNYIKQIKEYIDLETEILNKLDKDSINQAMNLIEETRQKGRNVFVFGNGGSGATAAHMENDFNKGVSESIEKKHNFRCLNSNMATIMAIANDNGYDRIFIQQMENKLDSGDVIIAISGSGNSANVIKAVEYARSQGCKIIGMSGYSGGILKELSDISLHVPVDDMQITEDLHIVMNHLMMSVFCRELSG